MLWGLPKPTDNTFITTIQSLINDGANITHALSFNEPDGIYEWGGSQITPDAAAEAWIRIFDPLRNMGIKAGAPAVMPSPQHATGFPWLEKFYKACQGRGSNCTADFMALHYYGNYTRMVTYLNEYRDRYLTVPFWITEYAYNNASLLDTEDFFNKSIALFDNDSLIERYSYFGGFRASKSDVGPNAAMLDNKGHLTDIGSWYLGGSSVECSATSTGLGLRLAKFAAVACILLESL